MGALAVACCLSQVTGYRYLHEGIDVLAPQAPELHEALTRVQEDGLPLLNLGGTVITTDRPAERGDNGKHRWYSGQHKRFGEVQETR
ncbi:hypothetical protein [Kocuria rosea]|uniref:hypothetical protein n=1 Tax=Kocuria rosea TaxID=1275 RepID=UPI00203B16D1|nr:hypothetical protein [Kocuria rosea]MCM3689426.1 hypothetical protein [Kocuria rosea]